MLEQVQIATIDRCNNSCWHCPRSYIKGTGKLMKREVFDKIIDELAEWGYDGQVTLYLKNEPLLDERLEELIVYTRSKLPKNEIMISSNGRILTKERLNALKDAGLDTCFVSCYDKQTYDKVKDWDVGSHKFFKLSKNEISERFNNRGGNVDVGGPPVLDKPCLRPFLQMYIDYNGKAILCCADYKQEVIMGDVHDQTLKEIWNSEKYKKYRDYMKSGKRSELKLCSKCNYYGR